MNWVRANWFGAERKPELETHGMSRFKIGAFGLLTIAALLMVVPASALAAPKHGHPGGPTPIHAGGGAVAYGSVTSTGTGAFVLTTPGSNGTPYTIGTTS